MNTEQILNAKDVTNIRFVFEVLNIRTFCRYLIRFENRKFAAI